MRGGMNVGLVYGRLRHEEKLLVAAARREGIRLLPQNDNELTLTLEGGVEGDAVLVRSLSATRALVVSRALASWGRPVINRPETASACMDKAETSLRLARAGVPTPQTRIAFDPLSARRAAAQLGYPVVLKPIQGSWARLVSLARDEAELAQLLEHREMLPSPAQHVYYMQEYIDKTADSTDTAPEALAQPAATGEAGTPGEAATLGAGGASGQSIVQATGQALAETPVLHHDLRAFVVGDETIAAIRRSSPAWLTNTARGATTTAHPVDDELHDLCQRAADAVGGGVLAIDLMEGPDGLVVHEINHSMEFRNSIAPTGVDIPAHILRFAVAEARR